MSRTAWRPLVSGLVLLLIALAAAGDRLAQTSPVARAHPGSEAFTKVLPAKVYSGTQSHTGLADAKTKNGYCVELKNDGHTLVNAADPAKGFSVTNGSIVSASYFDNGSATTADDIYCVVVTATRITNQMPRPDMVITWNYLDAGQPVITPPTLAIKVVSVALKQNGPDGVVGGAGTVCTEGWDATFLTGKTSRNSGSLSPNVVASADWDVVPTGGPNNVRKLGAAYQLDIVTNNIKNTEWCQNITADNPVNNVSVTLNFYALYDLTTDSDDRFKAETTTALLSIVNATKVELRHISADGQILQQETAAPNMVGAMHTACAIPSVAQDTLTPNGIGGATVFHKAPSGAPSGVPDGTLCFSWSSSTPGSQFVTAQATVATQNPTNGGAPQNYSINWDTDGNGNGTGTTSAFNPLVKHWDTFEKTVITQGGDVSTGGVTNGSITVPATFNINTGGFDIGGGITLTDWALGSRPGGPSGEPIEGMPLTLQITSLCGYFGTDPLNQLTTISGTTIAGRFAFTISTRGDTACTSGAKIHLNITATPPSGPTSLETLDITLESKLAETTPIVAWLGTTVPIAFPYSINANCNTYTVDYQRTKGQPGAFIGTAPGADFVSLHPDAVTCEVALSYESEDPGEVDIVVQIEGFPFSKVHIPIYFIAFEDIVTTAPTNLTVSERGDLNSVLRGWFPGSNPSGRPAELKNGVGLPKDRWILPDDWPTLKGTSPGFRPSWPGTLDMPAARVTFFMENEGKANNWKAGIKDGGSGIFLRDDLLDYAFNIHPDSKVPSVLGTTSRARIMSTTIDVTGLATVDIMGDRNLSYEDCKPNPPTGNFSCYIGNIVGRGKYYAIAEYPEAPNRGKWLPITSNTVTTVYTWKGDKALTWEDSPDPQFKYVVAHLKDRDGFCDARNFNNTLGIVVDFQIDSGAGIIVDQRDRPSVVVSDSRKFAWATTFDTEDENGVAVNADITQPVLLPDECQAWIKVSNSLLTPVSVVVTFPAQPSPVPGDLRISGLVCGPGGYVTLKNTGTAPVSLAGYGLRSSNPSLTKPDPNSVTFLEENLTLRGYLTPGQTVNIDGDSTLQPWQDIGTGGVLGNVSGDYARLVWDEEEISKAYCAGGAIVNAVIPVLPADGEASTQLTITVPFGQGKRVALQTGWNLVSVDADSGTMSMRRAVGANQAKLDGIYEWDAVNGAWNRYIAGAPQYINTLSSMEAGHVYWVQVKEPFTLLVPK